MAGDPNETVEDTPVGQDSIPTTPPAANSIKISVGRYEPTATETMQPRATSSDPFEEAPASLFEVIPVSRRASDGERSLKSGPYRKDSSHRKRTSPSINSTNQANDAATRQSKPEARSPEPKLVKSNEEQLETAPAILQDENDNDDDSPFNPPNLPKISIDQVAPFWERYNKAADFEDREFVKAEGVNLDTLLIFAGLFSGVNTAFILESLKTIQPDPAEQANYLLRAVVHVLQNTTMLDDIFHDPPFSAPPRAVRATIVFFASLSCSLTAAFGAVLGKQWLNHYEREGILKSPPARARERQKKYEARDRWRLEGVVETLPTVLQISLFLFFIGLVDYLNPINSVVSWAVMGFSLVPALFYVVTIAIATLYPIAPFQTRLSIAMHDILLRPYQKIPFLLDKSRHFLQSITTRLAPDTWFRKVSYLLTNARWLWESTLPTRKWLFLQASRLYRIGRPAWTPAPGGSSQPTPLSNEDTPDLLNMRCIIFTCKRLSTLHEISSVLPALDSLIQSLPGELDQNHPIVSQFVQTVINSVIQPIVYSTVKQENYRSEWEAEGIDLRYLVRTFHCFFIKWGHTSDFSLGFRQAMGQELWASFSREPLNTDLIRILAQIVPNTSLVELMIGSEPDMKLLDLLIRCIRKLERPFDETVVPHLLLFSYLPQHRKIWQDASGHLVTNWERKYAKVMPAFSSTIMVCDASGVDYWGGWMRINILLSHSPDIASYDRFSEYLLQWSKANYKAEQSEDTPSVQWLYLQSIHKLLQLDTTGKVVNKRLEEEGHVPFLLQLARDGSSLTEVHGRSVQSLNALFLFVTLWHRSQSQPDDTITTDATSSLYFSQDSLQVAISCWSATDLCFSCAAYLTPGGVQPYLELTVSYFEEAGRLNLLLPDMEVIVGTYRAVTEGIVQNGFMDPGQRESYYGQRQSLFDRMDRLVFVKQPESSP